jgi:hypothetical protein
MKTIMNPHLRVLSKHARIRLHLFIGIVLFGNIHFSLRAQVAITSLSANNAEAIVSDVGVLFNNISTGYGGYEIPSGSGINAIYQASMWFGGNDVNDQLHMALPGFYGSNGQDMWPGALDTLGTANPVAPNPLNGTLWTVTRQELNYHLSNYAQPGYVPPMGIINWPAHGDVTQGQAFYLAPFVDLDSDGTYEPLDGDYPCIKGDVSTYVILHDKGGVHGSGSNPIGIEQHFMFYQYSTNDLLNDVTFIDTKIINRGTMTLGNFENSFFIDSDLGNYLDDFLGCDSTRNVMYFYNADNLDESNGGVLGYGANPPAIGLVCLSHDITSVRSFSNGSPVTGDPSNPTQTMNVMHGFDLFGAPILDNNNMPTKFEYNGDPNVNGSWSEYGQGNPGSDRRGLMSVNTDVLLPSTPYSMTYAMVFAQGSDHLNSVTELLSAVDEVQARYDNGDFDGCYQATLGLEVQESLSFAIYPNPNQGNFHVDLSNLSGDCTVQLIDMSGRILHEEVFSSGQLEEIVTTAQAGVYVVKVTSGRGDATQRVVIE